MSVMCHTPWPPHSENLSEKVHRKIVRVRIQTAVSHRPHRAVVLRNSQLLELPTGDLNEIMPINYPA